MDILNAASSEGWSGVNIVPFFIALISLERYGKNRSQRIGLYSSGTRCRKGKAHMYRSNRNTSISRSERRATANTPWDTPDDRRHKMQEYLSSRRKVTYRELADEYGITWRTAKRDIDILNETIPLETVRGNGGGVKVQDGWHSNRLYMNQEQKMLLIELRETLTGRKREIMESILMDFILPM